MEEGNKVRKQYKERDDQCQKLRDEVTSLRNEVNEKSSTIKRLKYRSSYYESLEAEIGSLKEQGNGILKLRKQMEEGRKAEEIMKKQYLEKEEQYQVELNILKGKLEKRLNCYYFKIVLRFWIIFLVVKGLLPSNMTLVFMKLLKVNLVHKLKQGTQMKNLKFLPRR